MIRSALLFAVVVLFVVHPLHAQAQTFGKGGLRDLYRYWRKAKDGSA